MRKIKNEAEKDVLFGVMEHLGLSNMTNSLICFPLEKFSMKIIQDLDFCFKSNYMYYQVKGF